MYWYYKEKVGADTFIWPITYRPVSYTRRQLCLEGWSSRCKKRPIQPSLDCARQPVNWKPKRSIQVKVTSNICVRLLRFPGLCLALILTAKRIHCTCRSDLLFIFPILASSIIGSHALVAVLITLSGTCTADFRPSCKAFSRLKTKHKGNAREWCEKKKQRKATRMVKTQL